VIALWAWCKDALLGALEPAEREAVHGDFVELAVTDRQAAKSLLGLVTRRQLRLWRTWNPWFAVIAIVIPVCPLLEMLCIQLGVGVWPSLTMWLHHGVVYKTGLSAAAFWTGVCIRTMALSTWSWTAAFAVGMFARRTIWISGGLFLGLYIACSIWTVPPFYQIVWSSGWGLLPLMMGFPLIFIPAGYGIHQSYKSHNMKFPRVLLLASWTIVMGCLTLWTQIWGKVVMLNWSRGGPAMTLSQLAQHTDVWKAGSFFLIGTAVLTTPILYVLTRAYVQRAPACGLIAQG
jgi:hypothetical protein